VPVRSQDGVFAIQHVLVVRHGAGRTLGRLARSPVLPRPPRAEHVSAEVGGRSEECVPSTIDQRWMTGAEPGELQLNWCWVHTSGGWRLSDQGQG
jgi:hypothetical protein